ncbi:L-2-hydroxyglutarate dehydrogenase, mitochondrial isoform X4 [Folsomia candida]|uniref:L-2-hydroxyglutarate dehydrogenase, mitochondrial isoform X4 n=1 Tax=Folsomia candida TaxID=158441 RepID=UPI0016051096|nr:L-2-hydroxyglutarate dehydrogenase, mitochondrial isoform X4 [Folsomia candida]
MKMNGDSYDFVIVGGGIVGCATAMALSGTYPNLKMALLEKESLLAKHQSGHNSGVIHAGIYYTPGSLKAKLCVEGMRLSYEYLSKRGIPYKKVGKLIVAVKPDEIPRLQNLYDRGLKNNVPGLKLIDGQQIKDYEPYCQGLMGIWSPETGIVDYTQVTRSYANDFIESGGKIHTNFPVTKFQISSQSSSNQRANVPNSKQSGNDYPVLVFNNKGKSIRAKYVLTCGGLQSDRLSEMSGGSRNPRIIPFRGEYLLLNKDKAHMIRGNIYPVPDPRFPFLGVHFTPRMDGSVWLGPNAVLALKREGYRWRDVDVRDVWDAIRYPGFQKLALKYIGFGLGEMLRSAMPNLQLGALQEYIPDISPQDITRGPAGVRAQAMDEAGNLVEDFVFDSGKGELSDRVLHVRNAPSPGATSSLAIAKMILEKVTAKFSL